MSSYSVLREVVRHRSASYLAERLVEQRFVELRRPAAAAAEEEEEEEGQPPHRYVITTVTVGDCRLSTVFLANSASHSQSIVTGWVPHRLGSIELTDKYSTLRGPPPSVVSVGTWSSVLDNHARNPCIS